MKTFYYLPEYLIFECSKSEFKNIEFELAIKYLKLIYNDLEIFQNEFLLKFTDLKDLKTLTEFFEKLFIKSSSLTDFDLQFITDNNILNKAKKHLKNKLSITSDKKDLHEIYVKKIKKFLDNQGQLQKMDVFSSYKKVNTIKEYVLKEKLKKINFEIDCVEKLTIQSSINYLVCSNLNLKEIELNKELLTLCANDNQIENIFLNEQLQKLEIASNKLKTLKCNKDLKELHVTNNLLEKITLNKDLLVLICNGNKLAEIDLNQNLKELYCMNNKIEYLRLNEQLVILQAQLNPLKKIILNQNAKRIEISHPQNKSIEIDNSIGNKKVVLHYYIN